MVGHRVNVTDRLVHDNDEMWSLRCRLPGGTVEMENPMLEYGLTSGGLAAIAEGLLDFYRQVRQGATAEFPLEYAVGSAEMEAAFARSAELDGEPVDLPFDPPAEAEAKVLADLRAKYGVDPTDAEAMLDTAFPQNYDPRAWKPGGV